ncbi:facilitated trehalose transporter Tret1-like [Zerene cesonia]|uniref:facilitated trehalose transporter Tret1-like n=1 Tax=Zerene cesonia TaxID=33412 RepID=UPI0018E4FB58|nr:facilitated trehalose transporter Tret1-like [Zerene cesonia]
MRAATSTEIRSAIHQTIVVILINVPTISFGLALGWVSLASGEAGGAEGAGGAVAAAVVTFAASFVGVPLSAKAITYGRKFAVIAASAGFVICWSLKLVATWGGQWWMVGGRVTAGLGGAAAWALAPLLAREMCSDRWRGAAVSALPLAHNLGVLLMYLAADARIPQRTVLWWCLALSVCHCFVFLLMPESPSYLAAKGKDEAARTALAWLRGRSPLDPKLEDELKTLPPLDDQHQSSFKLAKEMLADRQRRVAFIIGGLAVVGQEACGVLAILQYAERMFVLARDEANPILVNSTAAMAAGGELASPARHALLLGAAQLAASALSLYLVERLGRRLLIVWCAWGVGGALATAGVLLGAGRVWGAGAVGGMEGAGGVQGAALAIAVAVAIDAVGLQPAPYALLADMFHYQYRGCALMLVTAAACLGNAVEVAVFPVVAACGGLQAALALAAALTLAYATFASFAVPETRLKTPEDIYEALSPRDRRCDGVKVKDCGTSDRCKETVCTRFYQHLVCYYCIRHPVEPMGLLDKLSVWLGGGGGAAVTVLVLGLDNSGKSTLLAALRPPERRGETLPTVAHEQGTFQSGGVSFSAWDVSGAARMRALWERHYRSADAVIFVVDSADHLRLVVAREELQLMLAHPDMCGRRVPLLLFANKSDAPHALPAAQVAAALGLERILDKPWHVCASSALSGAGVADGVAWLARQLREQKH